MKVKPAINHGKKCLLIDARNIGQGRKFHATKAAVLGIIALAIFALVGCKPNQNQSPPTVIKTVPPMGKPQVSASPITGAFGFTLGDKLPEGIMLAPTEEKGCYNFSTESNDTPPFGPVTVSCLQDRIIYRVQSSADIKYREGILSAIMSKYGHAPMRRVGDNDLYEWAAGGRTLSIVTWGGISGSVVVAYEAEEVLSKYHADAEKQNAVENKTLSSELAPKL